MERVEGLLLAIYFIPKKGCISYCFFTASNWLIRKLAWNVEEGTDKKRELNPELNRKNLIFYIGDDVLATITNALEGNFFAK